MSICEKDFTQRVYQNGHVKTVHGNHKPFKCQICQKDFSQRAHQNSNVKYEYKKQK
jgi:hypothetical protein